MGKDSGLGGGIGGAGRLVQQKNTGLPHERTRQGNLLPLTTTQLGAILQVLEPAPKHRVVALGQSLNHGAGPALARGAHDQFSVLDLVHAPYADILMRGHVVVHIILEDYAYLLAQFLQVVLLDIAPAYQDIALILAIQPREQFYQGGLPGTVASDQRNSFTRLAGATYMLQCRLRLGVLPLIGQIY